MIPREYYYFINNNQEEQEPRRTSSRPGGVKREKRVLDKPCPTNDGKLLQWNEQSTCFECPLCGYQTAAKQGRIGPTLENIGALTTIVTADNYGSNGGAATSKPIVRSKWKSRIGTTTTAASMSIEQQQEDRIKADVTNEFSKHSRGLRESPSTYLVKFKDGINK